MFINQYFEEIPDPKLRKTDRELVLSPIEGKQVLASSGMVDSRLWKGGNRLRAVKTEPGNLWYLKLDHGAVPPSLQQKFTSFASLLKFVTPYYEKRGLQIVEVKD